MDGIMDDEESEEDTERIVAGVFDELNIQIAEQLGPVPVGGGMAAKAKVRAEAEADGDMVEGQLPLIA